LITDARRQRVGSVAPDDHPQLEGAEPTRLLHAELGEPRQSSEALAFLCPQVRRHEAERVAQQAAVTHEHAPALDGDRQPLVRIEGERVGARHARVARRAILDEDAERLQIENARRPEQLTQVVDRVLARCGGELVLVSGFDADTVFDLIESCRATLFHGVPVMCHRMLDHPRWATADLSSLRLARTGAAPVSSGLMQGWLERGVPLTQGYGLTESAGAGFTLAPQDAHRFGKCGRPSFYAEVRLVAPGSGENGPAGEAVPPGEVGEIVLRGPQVMQGYWKEPEATAQALRAGWLWNGDLAVADEDGF